MASRPKAPLRWLLELPIKLLRTGSACVGSESQRSQKGKRRQRSVLLLVENCSVPFDRRVWQEAEALRDAG